MMLQPVVAGARGPLTAVLAKLKTALLHLGDQDRPEDWARGLSIAADVFSGTALGPLWAKLLAGTATAAESVEFAIAFATMATALDAERFRLQPYIDPDEAIAGMTVVAITAASATEAEISPANVTRLAALVEKLATIAGPEHLALFMEAKRKSVAA